MSTITITMSPEALARHLKKVADIYDVEAAEMRKAGRVGMRVTREVEALKCRAFAAALLAIDRIGFDSRDNIQIEFTPEETSA